MSSGVRSSSNLSRYLAALRQHRDLRPSQLAARLGASNLSKVGSMIRAFELGDPISDHWLELDKAEAAEQLERDRLVWEAWADEPIEPFLSIRYSLGAGLVRKVPRAFCNSREQAEGWAADELKRCPHKGTLTWSRRERIKYDECGLNPRRQQVTFEGSSTETSMQLSGSQQKFLLSITVEQITSISGLDQSC
jgi:hypothetical protein